MKAGNEIYDELKGLNSPLADMPRTMPYRVPDGYFSILTNYMTDGVRATHVTEYTLPVDAKAMPYAVPDGYFETLPQVMSAIGKEDEGMQILPQASPFSMPEGYFDALPQQMLQAAKQADKPATKTIPLGNRVWKNVQWAAAAVLLMGIGFGSYKMMQPATRLMDAQEQLAQLPEGTISDYVQQNIDDFDTDLIASTLNNNVGVTTSQLSDEEIIQYLDETGWEAPANNL